MDLENFESDIFWNFLNTNLNKIIQIFKRKSKNVLKKNSKKNPRIFQKNSHLNEQQWLLLA